MKTNTCMVAAVLAACCLAAGCAKVPEKPVSPILKIEPVVRDNREMYRMMVSAGLQNENGDVALVDIRGSLTFRDPDRANAEVMSLPFILPVILPFDTGIIEIDKTLSETEVMPLVNLMGSDREKLVAEKGLERSSIDEKILVLDLAGCEKKNILDLLRERRNEKN